MEAQWERLREEDSRVGHWLGPWRTEALPQPQLLASALSRGADYRLLEGGGNRLFCVGQRVRPGWKS